MPELIPNSYQDHFLRLTENGESAADAIIKVMHRYLDGKPAKAGKRILSAAERDLEFWTTHFWDNVSDEVFETEAFALALARYLQQNKATRPNWLAPDCHSASFTPACHSLFPGDSVANGIALERNHCA